MSKTINKISIKTIISLILVCALSITGIFSITAYAENIYQGGNIVSTGTYCGGEFSSGSNNKLTVRAMATNVYGSPNNVKLTLQKYGIFGWTTVDTQYVAIDGVQHSIWYGIDINSNTSYRILCSIGSGTGADSVDISLGIVTWTL